MNSHMIEIKKTKTALLIFQMILTISLFVASVYLLFFVTINKLGAWMIISYFAITLSILAIICHCSFGFKKGDLAYQLAIIPFMVAIFVNVLLPNREAFQIALLTILFALAFGFLLSLKNKMIAYILSLLMVVVALTFSIYSSIKANVKFLGEISDNWYTYAAMYTSIFIPTVMSGTIALTFNIRTTREKENQ